MDGDGCFPGLHPSVTLHQDGERIVQSLAAIVDGRVGGIPGVVNPVVVEIVVGEAPLGFEERRTLARRRTLAGGGVGGYLDLQVPQVGLSDNLNGGGSLEHVLKSGKTQDVLRERERQVSVGCRVEVQLQVLLHLSPDSDPHLHGHRGVLGLAIRDVELEGVRMCQKVCGDVRDLLRYEVALRERIAFFEPPQFTVDRRVHHNVDGVVRLSVSFHDDVFRS